MRRLLLFPLGVLKFVLLRLTFRRCGNCAHHYRALGAEWTGSCYWTAGFPLTCEAKADCDNKHVRTPACIHYRLFLWRQVWCGLYMHAFRYMTGRNIYLSTADGRFHAY